MIMVLTTLLTTAVLSGDVNTSQETTRQTIAHTANQEAPGHMLPNSSTTLVLRGQQLKPSDKGEVWRQEIILPPFKRGAYYRAYTLFSGNRVMPIWFRDIADILSFTPKQPYDIPEEGQNLPASEFTIDFGNFMTVQLEDDRSLAILPLVGPASSASFMFDQDKLQLVVSTHGDQPFNGDLPVYAIGYGATPYQASLAAWDQALALPQLAGMVQARSKKTFPEMLKYLGWASWEAYGTDIDEPLLLTTVKQLDGTRLPFRAVLVDDGYLNAKEMKLISFGVDPQKFPNGWQPLTNQRNHNKIKWFGVWRHMGGYMEGVSPDHTMPDLVDNLVEYNGRLLPKPTRESMALFYSKMTEDSRRNGFDFQKVDFQSFLFNFYQEMTGENAVESMYLAHQELDNATQKSGLVQINCMAQGGVNVFNSRKSAVMRNSMDYKAYRERENFTTVQSYMNSIWMNPVFYGDNDAFYSADRGAKHHTARRLAATRAMSGGPVYLYDKPETLDPKWVLPTIYSDGKILGTRAPGVALPDSVFSDPFEENVPFRAMAPLDNGAVAIHVLNVTEPSRTITGFISREDYPLANDMYLIDKGQDYLAKAELLAFDFYDQKGQLLTAGGIQFEMSPDIDAFYTLIPVKFGRSIIGLNEKFLSPQTYRIVSETVDAVTLNVKDTGSFMIWSPQQTPKASGLAFVRQPDGLWTTSIPKEAVGTDLLITFDD